MYYSKDYTFQYFTSTPSTTPRHHFHLKEFINYHDYFYSGV